MRSRSSTTSLLAAAALLALALASRSAGAAEPDAAPASTTSKAAASAEPFPRTALEAHAGPTAMGSTWRGDGGAGVSTRAGLLLLGVVSPDVVTRLVYSTVDDRLLTHLSLGVTGYLPLRALRPYARLAFVHQHEESRAAIEDGPLNAALGVGPGIRHRAGASSALGVDVPMGRKGRSVFALGGDLTATYFPDDRGPAAYFGATLWASIHHGL